MRGGRPGLIGEWIREAARNAIVSFSSLERNKRRLIKRDHIVLQEGKRLVCEGKQIDRKSEALLGGNGDLTRVVCKTFARRGKSLTPESKMAILEDRREILD